MNNNCCKSRYADFQCAKEHGHEGPHQFSTLVWTDETADILEDGKAEAATA